NIFRDLSQRWGGHYLQTGRRRLSLNALARLAEGEVLAPSGVCGRRLFAIDQAGAALCIAASWQLRERRVALPRPCRHRLFSRRYGGARQSVSTAGKKDLPVRQHAWAHQGAGALAET